MIDERTDETQFLRLLRMLNVARRRAPIGAIARSFGLETLVAECVAPSELSSATSPSKRELKTQIFVVK